MGGDRRWSGLEVTPANSHKLLNERLGRFFQEGARVGSVLALEVGCGDGRISELLYNHLVKWHNDADARLYTLDIAIDKIRQAFRRFRQRRYRGIYPLQGDLYNLPLPAMRLDYLVALNVFFWADRLKFLREAHRVLKNGGRMFVYDVIPTSQGPRPLATFSFDRGQIARFLSF